MKTFLSFLAIGFLFHASPVFGKKGYDYQLYVNSENYGIVIFPKKYLFTELDEYLKSIVFNPVKSGKAVMRYGSKGENETYMMPPEIQKQFSIEKFIIIQILRDTTMLIGIYDPEWGLTLPSSVYIMDDIKKNIPETLNVFRGSNPKREIKWNPGRNFSFAPVYKIIFRKTLSQPDAPFCSRGETFYARI